MEVTITFVDGTELTVRKNGDCFIADEKPAFPDDLSVVTVESEEGSQIFYDAIVQECASVDGKYWFAFLEESAEEKTIRELREENAMLEDAIIELAELIGG